MKKQEPEILPDLDMRLVLPAVAPAAINAHWKRVVAAIDKIEELPAVTNSPPKIGSKSTKDNEELSI